MKVNDVDSAKNLRMIWNNKKKMLSLTQEKAAVALGCTQQAVQQCLSGKIPLGMEATISFAKLLGVSPIEIRPDLQDKCACTHWR